MSHHQREYPLQLLPSPNLDNQWQYQYQDQDPYLGHTRSYIQGAACYLVKLATESIFALLMIIPMISADWDTLSSRSILPEATSAPMSSTFRPVMSNLLSVKNLESQEPTRQSCQKGDAGRMAGREPYFRASVGEEFMSTDKWNQQCDYESSNLKRPSKQDKVNNADSVFIFLII